MSATISGEYCINNQARSLSHTIPLSSSIYLSTPIFFLFLLPASNRAVASLPRASLGCNSRG